MQVYDVIEQAQAGRAMASLAATCGITEDQARAAAQAVLPELALGLERNTLSRGGLADLVTALGQGHHEQILETPRAWTDPRVTADGSAILGHILGSEHKTRALTARAAQASGLSDGIIQMLLPILAQLLMGAIARYAKGGLGDILSRLPIPGGTGSSGGSPQQERQPSDRGGGGLPGGGGFELPRAEAPPSGGFPMPPMPPSQEGDRPYRLPDSRTAEPGRGSSGGFEMPWPGNRQQPGGADDPDFRTGGGIGLPRSEGPSQGGYPMPPMPPSPDGVGMGSGGRDTGGSSLPLPGPGGGGNNPYGDLSDILRRGGGGTDAAVGGGGMWRVVRSLLGGVLGFGGRGIFGWIVRLLVVRYGWGFLQRILGRVLTGR